MQYDVKLIEGFAGEANYCWVNRATVSMPELTHYGYDGGTNYAKATTIYNRELMKRAKRAMGLTGVRGVTHDYGDMIEFRPYGLLQVMFIIYHEESI